MKFANSLMSGVGQGFQQFFDNFPSDLMQGMMDWLFSKLGEAGVRMPADFSLKSIVTLVMEILLMRSRMAVIGVAATVATGQESYHAAHQ